ncbi:MAG: hypothetical protein HPY66_3087 [Firmicutes bacterium]|nr:hypothetical protein [Bacillota bacterium]
MFVDLTRQTYYNKSITPRNAGLWKNNHVDTEKRFCYNI